MPRKRSTRRPRRPLNTAIRASVLTWLETGDTTAMHADNGWMLVALPSEARCAFERGDVAGARDLLAAAPGGHNYFVRG